MARSTLLLKPAVNRQPGFRRGGLVEQDVEPPKTCSTSHMKNETKRQKQSKSTPWTTPPCTAQIPIHANALKRDPLGPDSLGSLETSAKCTALLHTAPHPTSPHPAPPSPEFVQTIQTHPKTLQNLANVHPNVSKFTLPNIFENIMSGIIQKLEILFHLHMHSRKNWQAVCWNDWRLMGQMGRKQNKIHQRKHYQQKRNKTPTPEILLSTTRNKKQKTSHNDNIRHTNTNITIIE